jgi:cytochrome c biogenesis protein
MAHEARTRSLEATPVPATPAEAGPDAMDRVDGVLDALWNFLTSMRLALVLILAIAVLGVIGSLLIQAPTGVLGDPQAKADWLNGIRPRFGGWTSLMDGLQLFQIFNSLIFRILVAALTISLIACSVHRIPGIIRTARSARVDVGASFFEHAPEHEAIVVAQSPARALELVTGVLRNRHWRVLTSDDGTIHLYADRFRWAPISGLIGHLSLVLILAGAIVGSTQGYRDSSFTIAEGTTLDVAAQQGLSLKLVDFRDTYYTSNGAPSDYASDVILYKDGAEVERHTIRVNDPLRYGDVTFYQAFFGSAAAITVKDASGKSLLTQGVPLAWRTTDGDRPVGSLSIPGTSDVAWIVGTNGSGDTQVLAGQVQVEVYDATSGTQVDSRVIDLGKATTIGGLSFTFDRESQFTGLNVARDPGVPFVWLGAFLLFAGFVLRFTVPHKRLWARITARPNGGAVVGVAGLGNRYATLGTEFENLVNDIRTALLAPTKA